MADNVNHPAHYETGKFECIDVMLETQGVEAVLNFCQCNAFKYLYRAKRKNAEDDENASNEDKATNPPTEQENGENGANTEPDKATEEQQEDKVIIPQGKMRVTVICDGSLNIRRSAEWGNDNICGRAIRGQSYYVKEIHVVDGKKMVRTIGDLYLSGESEHVQFEQL